MGGDSSRHTTLGLLNKAKHFIKVRSQNFRMIVFCSDHCAGYSEEKFVHIRFRPGGRGDAQGARAPPVF